MNLKTRQRLALAVIAIATAASTAFYFDYKKNMSLAQQMVYLETGSIHSAQSFEVQLMEGAIHTGALFCHCTAYEYANLASKTQLALQKDNINTSLSQLLTVAPISEPVLGNTADLNACKGVFATYVLTRKQYTHAQAYADLSAMYLAISKTRK